MSEYQYYEFQTVDRPLTDQEQEAVGKLSSHIEVSPTRAVVTYSFGGGFRHDCKEVLAKYFDAMLYMANWGSKQLLFRFPSGLIDLDSIMPYCLEDWVTSWAIGGHVVLDIHFDEEGDMDWVEGEGVLSPLLRLRDDILHGDYRALYLAWLRAIVLDDPEVAMADVEPPVPAGLKNPNAALSRFVQVFGVDRHLAAAATASSPPLQAKPQDDLRQAIARLPRETCDDLLFRLAQGEAHLSLALNRVLQPTTPLSPVEATPRRAVAQLFAEAQELRGRARTRQAEEAERKRLRDLQVLAQNEDRSWEEVEALIKRSQAQPYEQAVELLAKLQELAAFQGSQAAFSERIGQLRTRYKGRPSLMERLRKAGL